MIDRSRAWLPRRGFLFKPFIIAGEPRSLAAMGLPEETELILFQRGDQVRTLLAQEMAYHHAAQGSLAGMPFLVTF
jgi:hypothetical protein